MNIQHFARSIRVRTITIGVVLAACCVPFIASADGIIVPPPDSRIYETEQEAVIFYEDGTEHLIVTTSFQGDPDEFAWIIPTPSVPTIKKGSWEIFVALREITSNAEQDLVLSGYGSTSLQAESYIDRSQVTVIEQKTVGYYDLSVLEARTTEALYEWFEQNGYRYPEAGSSIIDDYIDAGWYFTAVKMTEEEVGEVIQNQISTGDTLPLYLQFETDRIVYPMKMTQAAQLYSADTSTGNTNSDWLYNRNTNKKTSSKVTQPRNMPITLYIIADTRKSLPGFTDQYAGWISGEAVSELSFTTSGDPLLTADEDDKFVLTKLYDSSVSISEMTYDLYPRDEDNDGLLNDKGEISSKKALFWVLFGVGLGLTVLCVVIIVLLGREKPKRNKPLT